MKAFLIIVAFFLVCAANCFSRTSSLYINLGDSVDLDFVDVHNNLKGKIRFSWSFPYINSFHYSPLNEGIKNNTGFIGMSYGLEYFYKQNQYVNLSYSGVTDFFFPIVFVDRGDEYERMSSDYISLSNNHQVNRFSFGYGLTFAKNSWEVRNHSWEENSSARKPLKKTNNALGFIFSSHYRIIDIFHIGIIYKPTAFRLNRGPAFQYEHSISMDFVLKIPLVQHKP